MKKVTIRIIAYTPYKTFISKPSIVTEDEALKIEKTVMELDYLQFETEDEGETVYLSEHILKKTVFVIRKH